KLGDEGSWRAILEGRTAVRPFLALPRRAIATITEGFPRPVLLPGGFVAALATAFAAIGARGGTPGTIPANPAIPERHPGPVFLPRGLIAEVTARRAVAVELHERAVSERLRGPILFPSRFVAGRTRGTFSVELLQRTVAVELATGRVARRKGLARSRRTI